MCSPTPPVADSTGVSSTSSSSSSAAARPHKTCLACGKAGVKNRCGGCRRVYFCGRDCQRASWAAHRPLCVPVGPEATVAGSSDPVDVQPTAPSIPAAQNLLPAPSIPCAAAVAKPASESGLPSAVASGKKSGAGSPKRVQLVTEPVQVVEIPSISATAAAPEVESPPKSSNSSKKSKKAKKRRKARSNSLHAPPKSAPLPQKPGAVWRKERSISLGARKRVMWGDVSAREFARYPGGGSAVPYDGTWALGLGRRLADVELGSVLEVEELRERELQARAKSLSKSKRRDVKPGETRQFDYRRGVDNPLFSRLSEDQRKRVFAQEKQKQEEGAIEADLQLSSSPESASALRSRRKYSTGSSGSAEIGEELEAEMEAADSALRTPDFGCVSIEQLDEFARIRDSREVACGCSCGDLVKKVSKMNVKKLHAFLQERNVPLPGHGKAQLMALAKQVARQQKNCQSADSDCECARNGVACHSDTCEGCADDCWNPLPRYEYKSAEVKQYRKLQIAKWSQEKEATAISVA